MVMKTRYYIFVRILVLIIAVLIADGGKSFILENINVHFTLYHSHSHDNDMPGQQNIRIQADHEYYIEPDNRFTVTIAFVTEKPVCTAGLKSSDYTDTVWQPPKSA